jgi:hypothetical protein
MAHAQVRDSRGHTGDCSELPKRIGIAVDCLDLKSLLRQITRWGAAARQIQYAAAVDDERREAAYPGRRRFQILVRRHASFRPPENS